MLPLQLIYIRYAKTNKHYLLLYITERGDKVVALDSDSVSTSEASLIRSHLDALRGMSEENLISWMKNHIPDAYKKGLRYFDRNAVNTLHSYDVPGT